MKFGLVAAVLAGLVLSWRPEVPGDERIDTFVGCYHLKLGRWTRLWFFSATPSERQIPPAAFELDRSSADLADPSRFRVRPNTIVAGKPSRLDGWVLDPHDSNSVSITWTDGFTGVSLHVKSEKDTLDGLATAYTDARGLLPFPTARAVATRTACEDKRTPTK